MPKQVWAIRTRLELASNVRDLALFNFAIDCKLRGCDLLLKHTKLGSTARYLGVVREDSLGIAEKIDI